MSKSYWLKDQKGNFSNEQEENEQEDTFDPEKRYIGIRLQQGVPLLDRDWNELEDIRRYEEWKLRKWYVGNGTPDDGFKISAAGPRAKNNFKIKAGRCLVDGFDVVNEPESEGAYLFTLDARFETDLNKEGIVSEELKQVFEKKEIPLPYNARIRKRKENEWVIADTEKFIVKKEVRVLKVYEVAKYILYSKQQEDVAALTPPSDGVREDTVYLDVWIEEVTSAEDPALENSKDVNIETCVRHKLEWRVRVKESNEHPEIGFHHYYDLAKITWVGGKIEEVKDLRTIKLTLTSVRNELEEVRRTSASKAELEYVRQATVNRWIKGGEINDKYEIMEMLCIISGQEIKFGEAKGGGEIKEDENFVVLANGLKKEIEFIVTRKNLLEWLNSWSLEKWMPAEDTEPALKSTFTLPLYFFERPSETAELKIIDLRHHGVLDTWLTELAGRLDSRERRMCRVPLLQQTIFGRAVPVATVDVETRPCGVAFDGTHIWVANFVDNNVSKIDIITNDVETIPVGNNPSGVAFDGTHIWVANFVDNGDNNVSKIDIITNDVETIPVGNNSGGVAFDGTHIWVANFKDNNVSKIDILKNKEVETVGVGQNIFDPPNFCGIAFDGTHIWVANSEDNDVSKIDILENKVVETVDVGTGPYGIAFDGTHIWVANTKDNNVSKIDINTNMVVATVDVGEYPYGVAFDGTHIWVANGASNDVSKILRGNLK